MREMCLLEAIASARTAGLAQATSRVSPPPGGIPGPFSAPLPARPRPARRFWLPAGGGLLSDAPSSFATSLADDDNMQDVRLSRTKTRQRASPGQPQRLDVADRHPQLFKSIGILSTIQTELWSKGGVVSDSPASATLNATVSMSHAGDFIEEVCGCQCPFDCALALAVLPDCPLAPAASKRPFHRLYAQAETEVHELRVIAQEGELGQSPRSVEQRRDLTSVVLASSRVTG
ncbi:hypothetical protein V8D89_016341 [Ganoderma adspersum]